MEAMSDQHDPFDLVRHLAEDQHIRDWPCFEKGEEGQITFQETVAFKQFWSGFLRFAESAWWTRMWTVQEVILPKAGTLTYDTWSISLDTITKCGSNYYDHVWDYYQHANSFLP